jgi:hypothetical protein
LGPDCLNHIFTILIYNCSTTASAMISFVFLFLATFTATLSFSSLESKMMKMKSSYRLGKVPSIRAASPGDINPQEASGQPISPNQLREEWRVVEGDSDFRPHKEKFPNIKFSLLETDWQKYGLNQVLLPKGGQENAKGVIHFIGGLVFGEAPVFSYSEVLEYLADKTGFIIIASKLGFFPDYYEKDDGSISLKVSKPKNHRNVGIDIMKSFNACYRDIDNGRNLPVYRLSHSMGSKIAIIIDLLFNNAVKSKRSIFLAANNFDSIPTGVLPLDKTLADKIIEIPNSTFHPERIDFYKTLIEHYSVEENFFVKYKMDFIDCSEHIRDNGIALTRKKLECYITEHDGHPLGHLSPNNGFVNDNVKNEILQKFS